MSISPGAHSTSDIRNIALVGQAGSGKTLLTESLLLEAGVIRNRGSLERGTTVCDFDPQERQLRHSLDSALVHFPVGDCHTNLFDTPGYPDFAGRALTVLEAVETAAVVVSAVNGVEPVTQRMMDFARDRELCRLVIINKIDAKDAHPEAGAGAAARAVRARMPAAEPAGPRRQDRWWIVFSIPAPMPFSRRTSPRSRPRTPRSSIRWSRSTRI